MGASEIREFWKREILTAKDFLDLWLKEVPGDDPFGVLGMLADLAGADYRCLRIPGHIPALELFVEGQQKKRQEAQDRAVATLQAIVGDRTGIERAEAVQLRRDGLVEAFEARKAPAPRFLYPPSLAEKIRNELASGAFDAAAKNAKAAALGSEDGPKFPAVRGGEEAADLCDHSEDFRTVCWFGDSFTFSPRQARAIEKLWWEWKKGNLGLSQDTIGDAVQSSSERFQLRNLFRVSGTTNQMHAAWGRMIHPAGKGIFKLGPPV